MVDWFTATIASTTKGPPMTTLSLRTWVCNAAAVFAGCYGAVTRQIEDRLRVILAEDGPDHSTIARGVADQAEKAQSVLEALAAACVPRAPTLARDAIFLGGGRLGSASNRRGRSSSCRATCPNTPSSGGC